MTSSEDQILKSTDQQQRRFDQSETTHPHPSSTVSSPPTSPPGFWDKATTPSLSKLLKSAHYTPETIIFYLHWYRANILPALGPSPSNDEPFFDSFCNDDFSPVELRIQAGRAENPFNQHTTADLLQRLAKDDKQIDLHWFHHFRNWLLVQPGKTSHVVGKMASNEHMTTSTVSFDFNHDTKALIPKVYFYPIISAIEKERAGGPIVCDAIRKIDDGDLRFYEPLKIVTVFVDGELKAGSQKVKLECLSFDCIEPSKSRIKLYVRTDKTSWSNTSHFFTLGGNLSGAVIDEAVKRLRRLWLLLTGVDDPDEELPHAEHRTAGIIFNYELRPGEPLPVPRVYIPVRHYCKTDLHVAKALELFFLELGWGDKAKDYVRNVCLAFPDQELGETIGRHSYIGFGYGVERGVELTTYYNTMVFSTGKERDEKGVLKGPAVKRQRHLHV